MLSSGRETNKPYFGNRAEVHGVLQQVNDRPPSPVRGVANVSVMVRLTSVTVRSLAGLPDLEVVLQPLTELIGPRGSGKSRLLAAIAWLLSGNPPLADGQSLGPLVSAELDGSAGARSIWRDRDTEPDGSLPALTYLAARERIAPLPRVARRAPAGAALAEQMVARIAERRLAGVEGDVLLIEEPELMLTPQQQRHLYGLLRRFAERNQVIYSTRSPAMLDAVHHHEIVRLDLSSGAMAIRRAPTEVLSDEQRVRLEAEFDHERTEMFFATGVVLVEGQTERLSLPLMFRRLGHDPDALGISIVEVGGKGNLVLAAWLLAELRIPHVIVHDTDRGRPGAQENAAIRRAAGRAPVFRLDPDFEHVARINARDDKVLAAWRRFSTMAPERIPAVFRAIIETTVALATGTAAAEPARQGARPG